MYLFFYAHYRFMFTTGNYYTVYFKEIQEVIYKEEYIYKEHRETFYYWSTSLLRSNYSSMIKYDCIYLLCYLLLPFSNAGMY